MTKIVHNDVLDAALDEVATCTRMTACTAAPTSVAEATSTYSLAIITMTGGRYVNADDTSGRKCTVAQLTGVAVTTTGSATHVALNDGTSVLYVTECTGQSLTSGNTMTFNSWEIGIADPT